MKPEETIELTPDYRYALYYDDTQFDYLHDWDHDSWGLYTISSSRWTSNLSLDTFRVNDRLATVMEWTEHSWNHKHAETEIGKALTRAGYDHAFVSLNGGSQSVWAYVVVYWDPNALNDAKGLIGELEAWFSGQVFTITLERREVYYGPREQTIETWEITDSLSNVIFFDDYAFTKENCAELLYAADLVAA
jgi:hypothetical protein